MRMKLFKLLPLTALLIWSSVSHAENEEITVFYADNPPLICMKDGKLDCIAGQLINMAAAHGGFKITPREIPWVRTAESLSSTENSLFAATGRNEFTESSSNWYFEVYTDDVNLFTLDDKKISSDSNIQTLQGIVVRRGGPFANYVMAHNASDKIVEVNDWKQAVAMLDAGRADAMCLTDLIGSINLIGIAGIKTERINKYKVGEMSWSLVTDKKSELTPALINFHKSLSAAKESDEYKKVFSKLRWGK